MTTSKHEKLKKKVLDAMNELLSDISVPKATTKKDFREIKGQVNLILESLEESDDQ